MKYLLIILVLIFGGCSCKPVVKYKTITKVEEVKIKPPKTFLKRITIPEPPNQYAYLYSGEIAREKMLVNYILELLYVVGEYDNKHKSIDLWITKEEEISNVSKQDK
jgi:uncharacterized membrane protein YagU involved in acid resistance